MKIILKKKLLRAKLSKCNNYSLCSFIPSYSVYFFFEILSLSLSTNERMNWMPTFSSSFNDVDIFFFHSRRCSPFQHPSHPRSMPVVAFWSFSTPKSTHLLTSYAPPPMPCVPLESHRHQCRCVVICKRLVSTSPYFIYWLYGGLSWFF